jgi:hypothetical protein
LHSKAKGNVALGPIAVYRAIGGSREFRLSEHAAHLFGCEAADTSSVVSHFFQLMAHLGFFGNKEEG